MSVEVTPQSNLDWKLDTYRAPSFFTFGAFSAEGPSAEAIAKTSFTMTVSCGRYCANVVI